MNGYIHVYTGNGKGKTTAALGLAVRAAGAGLKVFIGQFLKQRSVSELKALDRLDGQIAVEQFGSIRFIGQQIRPEDVDRARKGLRRAQKVLFSGKYDLVVLDELTVALSLNVLRERDVLELIHGKPQHVELVITGRDASAVIVEAADLVTEMREVKHYYRNGVEARAGIER
jgi:cob(I)alamin adenosyltransferase